MFAASIFAPNQLVRLLGRLNRGEPVEFSHDPGGPHAFTILKTRGALVLRTSTGIALASGSTFSEVWRKRSKIGGRRMTTNDDIQAGFWGLPMVTNGNIQADLRGLPV